MAENIDWRSRCLLAICIALTWMLSEQVNFPPIIRNVPKGTTVEVKEDTQVGDTIFTLFVSDADADQLTFTVSPYDLPFEFDTSTTQISTPLKPIYEWRINLTVSAKQPGLDFETRKEYSVTIQVTDTKILTTAVLTVKILNANDNAPTLNVYRDSVTINEETPIGTSLNYSMAFSDADVSDSVYVGLIGDDASVMNINSQTGLITLNSKIDVDPNSEIKVFKPILFATDGTLTSTATITLTVTDINDNSPVCNPSTCYAEVMEEEKGSRVVCALNCTDRDSPFNGNSILNYTIIQGNNSLFGVSNSGAFSVLSPLDYEKTKLEVVVVRVEDSGSTGHLQTTATVSVVVKPANDLSPKWDTWIPPVPSDLTYFINENVAFGTSILTVVASDDDLDVGNSITYSMTVTATGGIPKPDDFSLDPVTGVLSTQSILERDGQFGVSQYTIILQASDGVVNSHVINRTIYLVVRDVNDNTPRFLGVPLPAVILQEDQARAGSIVTRVSASDDDSTSTNLTFSVSAVLSGNTPLNTWTFSQTQQGQLELASDLDLDADNAPSADSVLRLIVRDNGVPELTATATLTISFVSDNQFDPVIISEPGATPVQVPENTPVRSQVTQIQAVDRDRGQEAVLIYSITDGNLGQAFSIDSNGSISTQTPLDRETLSKYILTVVISDSGATTVRSVTTSVTILITDVNDNKPTCQSESQTVTVAESLPVNTVISNITCTDPDSGDMLTVNIKSPLDVMFDLNSPANSSRNTYTWELKLLRELDYDSNNQRYQVEIDVSDGKNIVQVMVTVIVTAVNEARPTFPTNPVVTVLENVIPNSIIVYEAVDTDYSPHNVLSYIISSVSSGGAALFNIESKTGSIHLLSPLDYEALPSGDKTYRIVVVAEDGGGLKGTGTVTVSVQDGNDNSPVCEQSLYFLQVSEKLNGSGPYIVLPDLNCTDMEDGKNLTYLLTQTPGEHFTITNGSIQLKTDSLDYETSQTHTLIISVMDSGIPSLTSTVTVYVTVTNQNDGGPVFAATLPVSVSETLNVGQFVVDVIATDPDGSDAEYGDLQYSIIAGDTQNQFFVDARNGRVSIRKKLDFETMPSYNLVIQAKERKGPNSASVTQIINVIDVNDEKPVCNSTTFLITVRESEPVNHTVIDLLCKDADAGTTLTYSILYGNTSLFKMSDSQLKLQRQLNYEELPTTNDIIILVSDSVASHDLNVSGTIITGSVDEGPPRFDKDTYVVHVLENKTIYSTIFTLTATDPDSPRDSNGQVKYSLVVPHPLFSIEAQSGQIILVGSLDREREATYMLMVKAEDVLGSNSANVSIIVDDVNDNKPLFKTPVYRGVVSETAAVGTSVVTVQATDADDPGVNNCAAVLYQLSGSSEFRIDSTTGVITTAASLNNKTRTGFYTLTVTAVDSCEAAGALSSTCEVNIQVTTSNLHAPTCTSTSYSVTVRENQFTVDDVILNVTAKDEDKGPDGDLTMNLINSQGRFYLSQSGETGQIHLLQNIDFDKGDTEFSVEIIVTDKGSPARSSTCFVRIIVDDINDNTPLCPRYINLDILEGETNLTKITCSDADANSDLSYEVISTTPESILLNVSSDGDLTSSTPLDYEISSTYQILVQVRDNGVPPFVVNVTIKLNVIDVNDNDPTFNSIMIFDLPENTPPGSNVLYRVQASSHDGPTDKITYTLSDTTYFQITPDTGEIRLVTAAPDYETIGNVYRMEVCISDTPNPTVRTACDNITVNILDSNDEPPQFTLPVYQTTVAEDASLGTSLITVTAIDKDASPRFSTVSYSIQEGNTEGCFRILTTGVLELIQKLDYEKTQLYFLIIQATDGVYNTTSQCFISVSAVNEHTPSFADPAVTVHVEENVPANTFVYTAIANDSDAGPDGVVRYSIGPGSFVIGSQTGVVSVVGRLDRESVPYYNLTVLAVDQGTVARTGTLLIRIIVDDVNDHAPTCDSNLYIASVLESALPGDIVATLNCVDDDNDPSDLNNGLTYAISSTLANVFTVDQSGYVRLAAGATLDRETQPYYMINITVSDQSSKSSQTFLVSVSLTVLDVNDNSPYFTSLPSASVPEDTPPGTTIVTITADDMDEGINKQLMFQITGGNALNIFSLNPTTGDLILNKQLDFEVEQQYRLLLTVRDRGTPARSATGTMTVTVTDVNDKTPTCSTPLYTVTVLETSTNEILVTVSCDDLDVTGAVTYNITDGNDGNFTIDARTGTVATRTQARLDFETKRSYLLEITASDGLNSGTTYVRVSVEDVNEFPPYFTPPGPLNISVPEDADINYLVYEFKTFDQDTGDTTKVFSIVGGNSAQRFFLDPLSGKLQLQNILDYENEALYILTVAVKDSGGLKSNMSLIINVIDVNDNTPTCQNRSVTLTIPEGIRLASVYTPSCSDADKMASPILEYSLPLGNHPAFGINSSTGQLSLLQPLDYELETVILLQIVVRETGITSPRETSIYLRINVDPVNEFDPSFQPTNTYGVYYIPEDAVTGTLVTQVTATDTDRGLRDGIVSYDITSGDPQGYFWIDETFGEIRIIRQLNREIFKDYNLTITATDSSLASARARSATATVMIVITDVNDHRPQLIPSLYSLNVSEGSAFGPAVVLAHLIVQDKDEGNNSITTISIVSGNDENKFGISGHDFILRDQLDYERTSFYEVLLEVTDYGQPPLRSSGRVRVKVLPVNEAAPIMDKNSADVTIPENSQLGTLVYHAKATDPDSESQGQITYSIDGNNPQEFIINPTTGQLFVNGPLDYDVQPNTFIVMIRATDGAGASDPVLSAVTLRINLSDVNDNAPKFSSAVVNMSVAENVPIGTQMGVIKATDADSGENGRVTYNLIGNNSNKYFSVDPVSGSVYTASLIDYEINQVFYLSVTAQDNGKPSLVSNCLIKADIINLNDNDPVISPQDFAVVVQDTSPVGETILTYSASDMDTAISVFSFTQPNQNFEIEPTTGVVRTKVLLGQETVKIHIMYIEVKDLPTPADPTIHTATATLSIQVDSRDQILVITGDYNISVSEDVPVNKIIFRVSLANISQNVAYAITDGNTDDVFIIDPEGSVQVTAPLDRETVPSYQLTIQVTDQQTPPRISELLVDVTLTDVNDNNPLFLPDFYNTEVAYNGECNNVITSTTSTDADAGKNSELSYYLLTGAYNYLFEVDETSGEIRLRSVAVPSVSYKLEIAARDGGEPTLIATRPARMRVDTFVPSNVVISFRLGISRITFLSQSETFLSDLEQVIRTRYPSAVVRLWCIEEYEGVAVASTISVRRLLADMPADVHVYALKDNSTNSEDNFNNVKEFLTQGELLDLVVDNPQGDPNSNVKGSQWDYYNITTISPYSEQTSSAGYFDDRDGMIVTIISILLALILFALMLFLTLRYCCKWWSTPVVAKKKIENENSVKPKKEKKQNLSKVFPEVNEVKHNPITDMVKFHSKSSFDSDVIGHKDGNLSDLESLIRMSPSSNVYLPRYAVIELRNQTIDDVDGYYQDHSYVGQMSDVSTHGKLKALTSVTDSNVSSTASSSKAIVVTLKRQPPFNNF